MKGPGLKRIGVVVPTLNAGKGWARWLSALEEQDGPPDACLVIDSGSEDNTVALAESRGLRVHRIRREEFNHGGTRQLALSLLPDAEVIVFLTQDAVFASKYSLTNLVDTFSDSAVGAAYGRQLPYAGADVFGAHARLFNYPGCDHVRGLEDRKRYGIKAAFLSNSFGAYRRSALNDVGGFPSSVILGEDTYVAGKMLLKGWRIAYRADATVFHSHDYSVVQELRRYFDIGVFHNRESWLLDAFGGPGGEGARFVRSELRYLLQNAPWRIPEAFVRATAKLAGYRLGKVEARLPISMKQLLSMNRGYWRRTSDG